MLTKDLNYWLRWIKTYHDQSINYSLNNIAQVAEALQLNIFRVPVITVAGTNGKGSCIATMESILLAHGYRVAAYTSPHMFSFTERVRINGVPVATADLCWAMQVVHDYIAAHNYLELSFFEFATAAALWMFKQTPLDVILVEVGLGGRLDAVNVVTNDIAVITSVDLDHCAYLGDTREAIGHEKAGIIKRNALAVYADLDMPASIGCQAQTQGARLVRLGVDYNYLPSSTTWDWYSASNNYSNLPMLNFPLANAAAGLQALSLLPDLKLKANIITRVFAELKIAGRFQVEDLAGVEYIFDVAHNPAAAAWLVGQLAKRRSAGKTLVIVGIAATKDSAAMFRMWDCEVAKWLICAPQGMRRATPVEKIVSNLQMSQTGEMQIMQTVGAAIHLAKEETVAGDRIVVFGSFHTVAEGLIEFYRMKKHGGF